METVPSPRLGGRLVLQALLPVGVLGAWIAILSGLIVIMTSTEEWVDHTDQVLAQLSTLESQVAQQTSALRGFVIAGDPSLLEQVRPEGIERSVTALTRLTRDNPGQGIRLAHARTLIDSWRAHATDIAARMRAHEEVRDLVSGRGLPLERQLTAAFAEMRGVEEALRSERVRRANSTRRYTLISTTGVGVVLAGTLALFGTRSVRKVASDYERTDAALREEAGKLAEADAQLRAYSLELEQRVSERTAALADANRQLEAFAYSVSHDLRAPLRGMQGIAQALREDYGDRLDDVGRDYAMRIVSEAAHLDALIQDLLTYSRLTRTELSFEAVPVRQATDEALRALASSIAGTGAGVVIEDPLPTVRANQTVLVQVLTNLISNAIKFGGASAAATVSAAITGSTATISVTDRGIGIDPAHHDRIFGVFERLHSAEQYPGTGIGLAIVRAGVERMGGTAGVESQKGTGSRFWFTLPLADRA